MKFVSTAGQDVSTHFLDVIAGATAADGGLYMPKSLPLFDDLANFPTEPAAASATLLQPFADASIAVEGLDLSPICTDALNFSWPLKQVASNLQVLELFHGPTCAFKDVGAGFLAAALDAAQRRRRILVATSGDTGGAVAAAFSGRPGFEVFVLYPAGRVSARQEQQLCCWGENVTALKVNGSFDDCQRLVKQAFADNSMENLGSANSINLGRLLPQCAYYATSSLQTFRATGEKANYLIPTGNLGNGVACVMARQMGFPIAQIVFCANANRTVPEFFASGQYQPRDSIATLASAMDVGSPSNFQRLRGLDQRRLSAVSINDALIEQTIVGWWQKYDYLPCPHTACALAAWADLPPTQRDKPWIAVGTAHPAKFETIIEPLIGDSVKFPPFLAALLDKPAKHSELPADYSELKQCLAGTSV